MEQPLACDCDWMERLPGVAAEELGQWHVAAPHGVDVHEEHVDAHLGLAQSVRQTIPADGVGDCGLWFKI